MNLQDSIFALIGGLGLFLFGIKLMGESLKAIAGDNLRDIINKYTSNKFKAVMAGILTTILIQSSSGTTALTISLVRAGLMELQQAIGVIMGSNIGTTITALMLTLSIKDYALPIIFLGAAFYMFSQKRKNSLIGQIIFGFGLLFYGMSIMQEPLELLSKTDDFTRIMTQVGKTPFLGILIGAALTMLVQSSSATIGILQAIYLSGMVSFPIAFAILLGDNIGTTITSLLASIGGSRDSKRAAYSHIIFNVFGTALFFIVMYIFGGIDLFRKVIFHITDNAMLQIALSHLLFNITVTFILIWFIPLIEKIVKYIVPVKNNELKFNIEQQFLTGALIHESPSLALQQGGNAILELAHLVNAQVENAEKYININDKLAYDSTLQIEIGVNSIDKNLKLFFRDLTMEELPENDLQRLNAYMYTINDLERIGDLAVNIVSKQKIFLEANEKFSISAKDELKKMMKIVRSLTIDLQNIIETNDYIIAGRIFEKEKQLDKMERKYYKKHLLRVKSGECTGKLSISYVDLLSDIERIGDHAENIAEYFTNANEVLAEQEYDIDLAKLLSEIN